MNDPEVCHAHSGIKARVETLEDNIKQLWNKWDGMQKLLIGSLVTTVLNLIAIIFLLIRTYVK